MRVQYGVRQKTLYPISFSINNIRENLTKGVDALIALRSRFAQHDKRSCIFLNLKKCLEEDLPRIHRDRKSVILKELRRDLRISSFNSKADE